jgi:hypothetical protein
MYTSSGNYNVAVGNEALYGSIISSPNGSNNIAVGYRALQLLSTANNNTSIGYTAGQNITTGSNNTLLGYRAGNGITTGFNNTLVGYNTGTTINTGTHNTILGLYEGANISRTVILADGNGIIYLYATGSKTAINKSETPNATLDVNGNTIITGSLTVTGPIRNIVNDGFVSCSLSTSGTGADRTILATFNEVDGTALTNPRQLVHWWTSTSQFGEAARTFGSPTVTPVYSVTTGSNVTPIASTSGSINHAVTNTSGQLGLRLTTANGAGSATVWFHTEVQGIIYSISTTIFNISGT